MTVSDTSALNYAVLIAHVDVLRHLYGRITIPEAVFQELSAPGAPSEVRLWLASRPSWIETQAIRMSLDPGLLRLDPGEREAIALATEQQASTLLLDDFVARREAHRRGPPVIGLLGVLSEGALLGLCDFEEAILTLRQTDFHMSASLERSVLARHAARARNRPKPS